MSETAIPEAPPSSGHFTSERFPLLLFIDGECAFCNRWAARVKEADHTHRIRFGAKQGRTFQQVAKTYPAIANVDSVVLLARDSVGDEDVLIRAPAIAKAIDGLPSFGLFALALQVFPTPLANLGYRLFSKLRGPLFGKWSHCRVPLEEDKILYVD